MSERRRRVAVLFGGRSSEHEISCLSARSVIDALDPATTEVIPIGIARDGRWHVLPGPPALPAETGRLPEVAAGAGVVARLADDAPGSPALVLADGSRADLDVVFPVLHGPRGEDGAIQGLLELAGVPYVGAGVLGAPSGCTRACRRRCGRRPVCRWCRMRWSPSPSGSTTPKVSRRAQPRWASPCSRSRPRSGPRSESRRSPGPRISTPGWPRRSGSSARPLSSTRSSRCREIECAVLGNDDPVASVCGEIVPQGHAFYDYEAKYLDEDGAQLLIPAPLEPAIASEIQRLAVAAFRAVACAGMARVDLFVRDDEIWLNEINTIPGFTADLDVPEALGAQRPGVSGSGVALARPRDRAVRDGTRQARRRAGVARACGCGASARRGCLTC